jgi:hypothetical protein
MKSLEERIAALEERNARVERDKRWEGSLWRKVSIMVLTYAVVVAFLFAIDANSPWINAIVPVIGFGLSTLTVSVLKRSYR